MHGVARQLDGVAEGAGAGPRHHPRRRQPGLDQPVQQLDLFADRQRVALGVGAEDGQANVLAQQPLAMPHEARRIGAELGDRTG